MIDKENIQTNAKLLFKRYLKANHLQVTRERFAILEAAYDISGFFSIEDLKKKLEENKFKVSTATLYTTTALLVEANLLIRHPFSTSSSVFERIADERPRCYQICSCCHKITRITSRDVAVAVNAYQPRTFIPTHRVMYVYGVCPKCEKKLNRTRQIFLDL
ncbi:MAG: transcriptional repressor [Bacteroidaceae bacterium]|nr:transcriptional repressor [Bacteroidaceae bacterium]